MEMILSSIAIRNFKNLQVSQLKFKKGVVLVTGLNGTGKTNLLDAVYFIALTKSNFQAIDANLIAFGMQDFFIEATFEHQQAIVRAAYSVENKKQFSWNGKKYQKLAEHIGKIPIVFISPSDIDLLHASGSERRKMIDGMLAQKDQNYLDHLLKYNKLIESRNALLKKHRDEGFTNIDLINTYGAQLIPLAIAIDDARNQFIAKIGILAADCYSMLSNQIETFSCSIKQKTNIQESVASFKQANQTDLMAGRTTLGPHTDDILFLLNEYPIAKFGSQGQQKSAIIALKLAFYQILMQKNQFAPLLLLDDLFEKIDYKRIASLFDWLKNIGFSQIFITDTHFERVAQQLVSKSLFFEAYETDNFGNIIGPKK